MKRIIESSHFDIELTETLDYKGEPKYVLRYGLSYKMDQDLRGGLESFKNCLDHAMQCEGLNNE